MNETKTLTLNFSSETMLKWFLEVKKDADEMRLGMYGEREIVNHVALFNRAMNALRSATVVVEEKQP